MRFNKLRSGLGIEMLYLGGLGAVLMVGFGLWWWVELVVELDGAASECLI